MKGRQGANSIRVSICRVTGQAELAWDHIPRILREADMQVEDIVKVNQYLTRTEDIPGYVKVRSAVLGDARRHSCCWWSRN